MTRLDSERLTVHPRMTRSDDTDEPTFAYPGGPEIFIEPLSDVLDSENFTPRLLALVSNALVRRESQLMLREFKLGTNDWRVISALGIRPGATSTAVAEFVAMNKALVSKSVNTLIARGLIVPAEGPRGSRPLYLTRAGAEMHAVMKPISLAGQEIVLSGLTSEEIAQLNDLLRRLVRKTPGLSTADLAIAEEGIDDD